MKKELTTVIFGLICTLFTQAELSVPKFFGDNMILQRRKPIKIWGKATPGEKIKINFAKRTSTVKTKKDGTWLVKLPSLKANSKGQTLIITGEKNRLELKNILIGDVWFCAGQSNMEMPVNNSKDCAELLKNSNNDQIRVGASIVDAAAKPGPLKAFSGWHKATTDGLSRSGVEKGRYISGTAYSFAHHYQQKVKVPVGIIVSAWGGTRIEAWSSAETIKKYKTPATTTRKAKNKQAYLYNALVHPYTNFSIRGFLWYQGEQNISDKTGHLYADRFNLMIKDWRAAWQDSRLPFLFVQICPFNYRNVEENALQNFWKQQEAVLKRVRGTFMAKTEDIGNLKDIHPHNKLEVGRRLSELATAKR